MYWIAFGDIHESTSVLGSIPGLSQAEGVIVTGDITNRGTRESIDRVVKSVTEINSKILAVPGNMDTNVVQNYLRERDMDIHLRVRELTPGVGLMGVGFSAPTPFGTPSEVPDATIGTWLDETFATTGKFDKLVVVVHEPPYGTAVDMLGDGTHVGSPAVLAFIERVQPDIVLTGHIHESRAMDMIGQTPVFNSGMLAGGGFVRMEFQGGELTAELMSV